ERHLLGVGGRLPEAPEGQRDVVRFALQAAGRRPARVAAQPGEYDLAETALHPLPRLCIALDGRTAEEFQPVALVAWLATTIGRQFLEAVFCQRRIAQRP